MLNFRTQRSKKIWQTGRKMNGHPGKKKRENEKRAEICKDARLRE
jgi:hypothetical protein